MSLGLVATLQRTCGHGQTRASCLQLNKQAKPTIYATCSRDQKYVIYNDKTGKYVMWMHIDDANYNKASVCVDGSDYPTAPFQYLYSKRPHGFGSMDMTVFKDNDGIAYLIYSSKDNNELHIGPLTEDYLEVKRLMRRILIGQHHEAPTFFKHKGTYYMITSGCTSWAPNEVMVHAAESILGPWETLGNPCIGPNKIFRQTTFFSQSTIVLLIRDLPGYYIFMANRGNSAILGAEDQLWSAISGSAVVTGFILLVQELDTCL